MSAAWPKKVTPSTSPAPAAASPASTSEPTTRSGHPLIQPPEIHRNQLANPRLLHRHPVDHIHGTHRHFIMRNDNELRILAELPDHVRELPDVRIIQRRIHFIQDTERRRLDQ